MYLAVFFFLGGGAGFLQDVHPSVSFRRLVYSGAICWGEGRAGPRPVAMRAGERFCRRCELRVTEAILANLSPYSNEVK